MDKLPENNCLMRTTIQQFHVLLSHFCWRWTFILNFQGFGALFRGLFNNSIYNSLFSEQTISFRRSLFDHPSPLKTKQNLWFIFGFVLCLKTFSKNSSPTRRKPFKQHMHGSKPWQNISQKHQVKVIGILLIQLFYT